mgnify:CR=1 FL=1
MPMIYEAASAPLQEQPSVCDPQPLAGWLAHSVCKLPQVVAGPAVTPHVLCLHQSVTIAAPS